MAGLIPDFEHRGSMKYTGLELGTAKWKGGVLKIYRKEKDCHLDLYWDCNNLNGSPAFSIQLNKDTIGKIICKSSLILELFTTRTGHVTINYKPFQEDKVDMVALGELLHQVKRNQAGTGKKAEVGGPMHESSPARKTLFTSFGRSTENTNITSSPHKFTSVKENKKNDFRLEEDSKENQSSGHGNRSASENFLQRGTEKSRAILTNIQQGSTGLGTVGFYKNSASGASPLYCSTPNNAWKNSKRTPGLMPDPIPAKRPRLLSDTLAYSWHKNNSSTDTKQQPTLQGFSNLGNTCYMNAILQSLFGLDSFSIDLIYNNRRILKQFSPQSLYYTLAKLLNSRKRNIPDLVRRDLLRNVKTAISSTVKRFSGYQQHDAHEFLSQVLDQLKEEVIKLSKSTPSQSPDNNDSGEDMTRIQQLQFVNPTAVNFEFEVIHTITCIECHEEVNKTEQFHDISLDLPRRKDLMTPRSLQDALDLFFRKENIEYTCEKCGQNKSEVSHKFVKLPRVLILHLKRYSFDNTLSRNTKMLQNVTIPQFLTLQSHCDEETQPAHPVLPQPVNASPQKCFFDDHKDDSALRSDTPRRKLDYKNGYTFKKMPTISDSEEPAVGSTLQSAADISRDHEYPQKQGNSEEKLKPITIEDEEDTAFARAVELSLKEAEDREQKLRDYGDDDLNKALEISKHSAESKDDFNTYHPTGIEGMSEEDQIQLAIEQSLRESENFYTGFDDVQEVYQTDTDDLERTSIKTSDIRSRTINDINSHDEDVLHSSKKTYSKHAFNRSSQTNYDSNVRNYDDKELADSLTTDENNLSSDKDGSLKSENANEADCDIKVGKRREKPKDGEKTSCEIGSKTQLFMPTKFETGFSDSDSDLISYLETEFSDKELPKEDHSNENTPLTVKQEQNSTEPVVKDSKGNNLDLKCSETDDNWMCLEDKENKLPARPVLTDPNDLGGPEPLELDTSEEDILDIPKVNNEKGDLPYSYRLVSLVNHIGATSVSGHYISDVYDIKKRSWFSFDDSHVAKTTEQYVRSKREKSGYIFFYLSKDIFDDLVDHNTLIATPAKKNTT